MIKKPTQNETDKDVVNVNVPDSYASAYISILCAYEKQITSSIAKKNELKSKFFSLIKVLMIALIVLFFVSVIASFSVFILMIVFKFESSTVIVGAVTGMISTLSTMILSIYKMPEIIAKYLFNKKEDKRMNEVIGNIQQYEISIATLEKKSAIDADKKQEKKDAPIQSSPNIKDASLQNAEVFEEPTDIQNDANLEENISQNQNTSQSLSELVENN